MLSPDISFFENIVDQDQLASQKPADHDLQCLPYSSYIQDNNRYHVKKMADKWGGVW